MVASASSPTGAPIPVSLEFDAADVPYGSDTMQVMSMVGPFLCVGVVGAVIVSGLAGPDELMISLF